MDKKAMLKQAAHVLREQKKEITELREKLACSAKAEDIVKKLIENDDILADEVFQKLSDLRSKSLTELDIMEKAAQYFGNNNIHASFGKLSDHSDSSSNPLIDFLFSDL